MADLGYSRANKAIQSSALATGISNTFSLEQQANRESARLLKEERQQQLRKAKATELTDEDLDGLSDIQSETIKQQQQELRLLSGQNIKQMSISGLSNYIADGDPKHLNNTLADIKKTSMGANAFSDIVRFQELSENDVNLLNRLGITWEEFSGSESLKKEYLAQVNADGSTQLTSLTGLSVQTGHYKQQQAEELQESLVRAQINKALLSGTSTTGGIGDGSGTENQDRAKIAADLAKPEGVSDEEWNMDNPEDKRAYSNNLSAIVEDKGRTAAIKNADETEQTKIDMDEKVSSAGFDTFFDVPITEDKYQDMFEPYIQRIEKVGGLEYSPADKKNLLAIRKLASLGADVSELSEEHTGLFDSVFKGLRKYWSNDTEGSEAATAHTSFRNVVLRAFAGSAQSAQETKRFVEAFGNLKQQQGPVFAQFKVALSEVKTDLETIMDLGDRRVSYYRLGMTEDSLNNTINSLELALEDMNSIEESNGDQEVIKHIPEPDEDTLSGLNDLYESLSN